MPKVAIISLDENVDNNAQAKQEFAGRPFDNKLAQVKEHIEAIARANPTEPQIVTMREYMLGRPITPEQNKAFKTAMCELTLQYPNLVIIGNTPTVRNYEVTNGRNWVANAANAVDPEDELDTAPSLAVIESMYNTEYHKLQEKTESGDNKCIAANREFVTDLQEALVKTPQTIHVGIMKNNTYVFQNGGYEYHTKIAPIDELSGTATVNEGQVLFMPKIDENYLNDLDKLKERIPSLGGKTDQMFLMDEQIYLWKAGQNEPPELIPADDNPSYKALREKLSTPPSAGTRYSKSTNDDLRLIHDVTQKTYKSNVQIFCPGSTKSQNVFSIKTPAMNQSISLGIDTCREYSKGALKSSTDKPPDIHLVVSDGMTFNARPPESTSSSNHGSYLVVNDSKQPLQINQITASQNDLVLEGYQDNLFRSKKNYSEVAEDDSMLMLSEPSSSIRQPDLFGAKPLSSDAIQLKKIEPKENLFTPETLDTLNKLESYVDALIELDKKNPDLAAIKTEISSLYEAGFTSGNQTAAYKQLHDLISKPPFEPPAMNEAVIIEAVGALDKDANNKLHSFLPFIQTLDNIDKMAKDHKAKAKEANSAEYETAAKDTSKLHQGLSHAFNELNNTKNVTSEQFQKFEEDCDRVIKEAEASSLKENRGIFGMIRNALNQVNKSLCITDSMNNIRAAKKDLAAFKESYKLRFFSSDVDKKELEQEKEPENRSDHSI